MTSPRVPQPLRPTTLLRILLVAAAVGAAFALPLESVVIAPTALYVGDGSPTATLTLHNPSSVPEEVSIEAVFGYPTTDPDGALYLHLDADGSDPRSAAPWVRAFPRRTVVGPGERQRVRILVDAPPDTPDGEYWSRLVVTSRGQRVGVEGGEGRAGVQVGLDLEVRTILALTYRKGTVATGIRVEDLHPVLTEDSLVLRPRLIREGDGAYIGRLRVRLVDPSGREVGSWTEQVAVYRDHHRRLGYPVGSLPPGEYRVDLELTTEREDVPAGFRLATPPVRAEVWVRAEASVRAGAPAPSR